MADEYEKPPYRRDVGIPAQFNWQSLKSKRGAELEGHYVTLLRELGTPDGHAGADLHESAEQGPRPSEAVQVD